MATWTLVLAATLSACDDAGVIDGGADAGALPPAARVFVAGSGDGRLHVFDLETLERVTSVAVPDGPGEVRATPDGRWVWTVAREGGAIAIVDTATLTVRHEVGVGARPVHSFLEPGGARIWVGNDGSGDVSIVEIASGSETRVLTGNGHHKMAMVTDAAGALRFAYVSNISDGTISVLDPTPALVMNVSVGPAPHGMGYSAQTGRVYNCSGDEANSVEVLDPDAGHSIVSRIPLPARCGYLHVDEEDDGIAWATLGAAGLIARIELATETVETWPAGESPDKLALVGDRAFVANVTAPTVTVVDLRGGDARSIAVGAAVVVDGRGHRGLERFGDRIFVPNEADGTVSVIDVETETVIATLDGIEAPSGIAVADPTMVTSPAG